MKNTKTNLKISWVIPCTSASVDSQTNTLSLFNIIEEFGIKKSVDGEMNIGKTIDLAEKTSFNAPIKLVVFLERDVVNPSSDFSPELRIIIKDPEGTEVLNSVVPILFEEGKKRMRIIVNLDRFLVTKSGEYLYTVTGRGTKEDRFTSQVSAAILINVFE